MDTNVNYTLVGAFVIVLTSFMILGIIWLSSGFGGESYTTYAVMMQESVSGMSVDSPVEFNGVNVGTIKSIRLDPKNPRLVKILLEVKNDTPITQGTIATIDTKGVTGVTFVALKDKSTDLRPLKALPNQPYPIIPTEPSIFLRLDAALTKLSASFTKVSESIQTLLNAENLRSINQTLKNLDTVTSALVENSTRFSTIMSNTAKASQQFSPAMQSISIQTLPNANRALSGVESITTEIKQNPSVLIRGTAPLPPGPGEK